MKLRKHLSKVEAELIGLEAKQTEKYKNKRIRPARYTISEEEFQRVKVLREIKSTKFKEVKRTLDKKGDIVSRVEKRTCCLLFFQRQYPYNVVILPKNA